MPKITYTAGNFANTLWMPPGEDRSRRELRKT